MDGSGASMCVIRIVLLRSNDKLQLQYGNVPFSILLKRVELALNSGYNYLYLFLECLNGVISYFFLGVLFVFNFTDTFKHFSFIS